MIKLNYANILLAELMKSSLTPLAPLRMGYLLNSKIVCVYVYDGRFGTCPIKDIFKGKPGNISIFCTICYLSYVCLSTETLFCSPY